MSWDFRGKRAVMFSRKDLYLLLFLCIAAVVICSCGNNERISPDALMSACEKCDAERYRDYSELQTGLDNPRAMDAGMYMRISGPDAKKLLRDKDVNKLFDKHGEDIPACLYSDGIDDMTFFVRSVSDGDGSASVVAVSMSFGKDTDAGGYCDQVTSDVSDILTSAGRDSVVTDDAEDGGILRKSLLATRSKHAMEVSVYNDGYNVFVILACEQRSNAMKDIVTDLVSLMNITPPDLDSVDCTAISSSGNRVLNLCEELEAVEIRYELLDQLVDNVPFYLHSDSAEVIELSMLIEGDNKFCSMIEDATVLFDTSQSSDLVTDTCKAVEFVFDNDGNAESFMDYISKTQQEYLKESVISSDGRTLNGIRSYTFTVDLGDCYSVYSYYVEGNKFYHFQCLMMTEAEVNAKAEWIAGVMGFDR